MMKKTLLFSGAVIALLSAGCRPELAEGVYGAEEQQWYQIIKDSYPGYRPPRIASPATVDKASPEALEQQRSAENSSVVEVQAPADDAATSAKVDAAADKTKKEDKKADVKDVKAEDKKADAKDAKAEDKKADAKDAKAEDKKADAKDAKAEDKKADAKDAKAEDKKADAKDAKAEDKKADAKDEEADYVIYKVQAGDTPGSIARKFYGKASMYEVIMKANPQIKDAKLIQIGTELKVPKL
ncbi:MAG: LysM peptidoglycan-binding domain-containing protein [Lentisphaerae bacterium]|nr:LysM peptidoglycan-binding domain-containing protein [Lentisphaerota bacterium]